MAKSSIHRLVFVRLLRRADTESVYGGMSALEIPNTYLRLAYLYLDQLILGRYVPTSFMKKLESITFSPLRQHALL